MSAGNVFRLWQESLVLWGEKLNLKSGEVLKFLPEKDDQGSINFGNGTLDLDVKFFLGTSAKYGLFDVGNSRFAMEGAGIYINGAPSISLEVVDAALTVGDSYSGIRVAVTAPAAHNEYGMAGYFDSTITGTTAGHCYGLGSWINTATTPVLSAGHIIVPLECGVYTGEAQATARIVLGQFQAILGGVPASLHVFRVNTNRTTTAVFAAGNPGSLGYVAGAGTSGTQVGYIPIADIAGGVGVVYVRVYSSAT